MTRMKKWLGFCALLLAGLLLFSPIGHGLGDDVDYGWDSGSWDSGSSWDSDSSWDWDDDDDDYSYSSGGYGGGGGGYGGGGLGFLGAIFGLTGNALPILVLVVILYFAFFRKKQSQGQKQRTAAPAGSGFSFDPASIRRLKQQDPGFSEADIEAKVKNWVIMFENAWCDGDMTPVRPFVSDGLYNSYQQQLSLMKQNKEKSCSEDLAVLNCQAARWRQDGDKEYLDMYLKVKKRTYKVHVNDPDTVLKGDKDTTYHLDYIWQLMRSAGSVTQNAGVRVQECPNCGAQTSVNQSGKCQYCGSTLVAENFDWVLNKVDKLGQQSHR